MFAHRGYRVIDIKAEDNDADGFCAQFKYKGRIISFSTLYPNEISVALLAKDGKDIERMFPLGVESAIEYVNNLSKEEI